MTDHERATVPGFMSTSWALGLPVGDAVINALKWMVQLEILSLERDVSIAAPHVTVSAHKEIVLEWWHESRKLTVYFAPSAVEFVRVWGSDIESEMQAGEFSTAMELLDALNWLRR